MTTTPALHAPAPGAVERLACARSLLAEVLDEVGDLPDDELVPVMQGLGAVLRVTDGLRSRAAGEAAERSERGRDDVTAGAAPLVAVDGPITGDVTANTGGGADAAAPRAPRRGEPLSSAYGCRNGVELIQRTMGVSSAAAHAWVRLDARTRPRTSITGQPLPAPFPAVGAALRSGELTDEAARLIVDSLSRLTRRGRTSAEHAARAEAELVAVARWSTADPADRSTDAHEDRSESVPGDESDPDAAVPDTPGNGAPFADLRVMVDTWCAYLDRDGIAADAEEAARRRGVNLGRERDGLVRIWGELVPETAAGLVRLIDAYKGSPVAFGEQPADQPDGTAWGTGEIVPDERTAPQIRHDVFASIVQAAARCASAPTIGGAAPTLLVSVDADQLDGGFARIDGIDAPVPATIAHRIACTGSVQKVVFDRDGAIIALGAPQRLFTSHQRRAIALRDGGCIIPGCEAPAAWCEIHHVEEHVAGGETHTSNGVLLCWWHHHNIDRSGWRIEMRRGVPHVSAPRWIDRTRRFRPVIGPKRRRPMRT